MSLICLSIPIIDLFVYAIWIRWSSIEKKKMSCRNGRVSKAPYLLKFFHFGTTWTLTEYTGITEFLWKFVIIGLKGLFISFMWPFWIFPILIGCIVYVIIKIMHTFVGIVLRLILGKGEYEEYTSISSSSSSEDNESEDETEHKGDHSDAKTEKYDIRNSVPPT